ncbi:MAG: cobaltochelatase subunit CobN [Candidatus Adiutrix sp.]|jgi:cobaltochelatase CobN|nr:cobaltochelatase subunit CobN [Candidatus Adiutrix sp.]
MIKLSLVYFSFGGMEIPLLSEAVSALREEGHEISVTAKTASQLFDQARQNDFAARALAADALIIALHGGRESFPAWKALETALEALPPETRRPLIHVQPTGGDAEALEAAQALCPDFGSPDWETTRKYLDHGGRRNFYNLLRSLYRRLSGEALECEAPMPHPFEGLYHPDLPHTPELSEYLALKVDPSRPTVGIWFYQTYWLNNNLAFIDALIRAVEAEGANVVAVFHLRYKDVALGNEGAEYVAKKFFLDEDGRSRIDVLLSPMGFSLNLTAPECRPLLPLLNVPVLQTIVCFSPREVWRESLQGLPSMDVTYSAALPEFDGNLISVPFAFREEKKVDAITGALLVTYEADEERTAKVARLGLNWARLRRTPAAERRVAVIFHHYPPRNDRIGCAAGLDSFASVVNLLKAMKAQGYKIDRLYDGPDEMAHEILERLTSDRRWLTPEQMAARAEAQAGPEEFRPWHEELPETIRKKMNEDWGEMPGELFVHDGRMFFAGLIDGNVFLTIQPTRGLLENVEKIYHDMHLSPPHQYLAHYRWIRDVFKAHAVMHIGKHGSLEWLPGKGLGLSEECFPDLAIMELPNIYPYIINDPGEGTQAKRRSYAAVVDHLTPAFTNADLYDDLAKIAGLVGDYNLAAQADPGKLNILRDMIWEAVAAAKLNEDMETTAEAARADFPAFLEKLHSYIHELSDTMIADGLHILGQAPEGRRLTEFAVQLTRLANGETPSLREALSAALGYDYDELLKYRGRTRPEFGGLSGADVIGRIHERALKLVEGLAEENFDPAIIPLLTETQLGKKAPKVEAALRYIAVTLTPNIKKCREEIDSALKALAGGFVWPGPSGAPSRGQADILPTGRNFYSVDPRKVPSPAAWKVGMALAEALIERALAETGRYPQNVGILVYGSPTMRSQGDDVAEILYLMGLKPIWRKGGTVGGLEVIPLSELKRPRIDVTPRISGFFRDSFPILVELLDEAVEMTARLNEPPESNFIRQHVYRDLDEYRAEGLSEDEAWREATFRVFGCPPGTYGAGVAELVESKQWRNQDDLGDIYIRCSGHAYGRGQYGLVRPAAFRRNLARMDVTVKNEDSREYDMMSCTDYYNYYGGLIAAAKTVRGAYPLSLMGDGSDPGRVKVRSTHEEAKHVLRARLVNPKWLSGLKRHGYKGAGDISHMMDVLLGWDATAEVVDDWMYEKAARAYALDPDMATWMKEVNPHALQNILDKLLEAVSRGMWRADEAMEKELREAYLEIEGELEEWSDPEKKAAF